MEAKNRLLLEVKEPGLASGGRQPAGKSSLSSFQFPKKKKWGDFQAKPCSMQQAFRGISSTSLLRSNAHVQVGEHETQIGGESHAQASARKTVYNLSSWQTLKSTVQRQANTLMDESSNARRQKSLTTLKEIFIQSTLPHAFYNNAFPVLRESLLLCLSDPTEAARHLAAELLYKFLCEVAEVDGALGYVLEALVPRFGSQDIEGVAHLPPIMRPEPEYKPLQLTPVEKSEDVRQVLCQVLRTVLDRSSDECVWNHLDLATGLLRAAAMDICPEIKMEAICGLVGFCDRHQQMLLHFTEPLTRSLLSCLVHQKAKIRIGALWALTHVLACGLYKYNGEIIQMLAGWRDPNFVPIKSLYEATTTRNYFAELLADNSPMVRMFFFDTLANWLLYFKDKADYEGWILPYLLSGLFDPFRPIQQLVFSLLERLGKHYEDTHERELREIKQLGTPEPWSYGGKAAIRFPLGGRWEVADETCLSEEKEQFTCFVRSYCERLNSLGFLGCSLTEAAKDRFLAEDGALVGDPSRPSLGTRMMVRTYCRRYIQTLFQPVEDFKEVTVTTSARLLVVSLAYVEDSFVEWLDSCLRVCSRVLSSSQSHATEATETYRVILRLVGLFIDPRNYWSLVKDNIEEPCAEETHHRVGMVGLLALMLEGSFKGLHQAFDESLGLGRLTSVVPDIAEALSRTDILRDQCVCLAAENVIKVVDVLLSGALQQKAAFSDSTSRHLLSVIGSVAHPGIGIDDSDITGLDPAVQRLLRKFALCQGAQSQEPAAAVLMWFTDGLSRALPPSNLAALNAFLRWSPLVRLLEEEPYKVALAKLEEFSAATQRAATRREARRTALWIVRRLTLLDPAECSTIQNAPLNLGTEAAKGKIVPHATPNSPKLSAGCKSQAHCVENTTICVGPLKPPANAAAEILDRIVLSGLKKIDRIKDFEDTLIALKEFLTLPQPTASTKRRTTEDVLVMSGMIQDLCSLLRDPCLHTKLFCASCEAYAHDCAATYPGKSPMEITEDMPLGKRRELRLSATAAAVALKNEAVLLLKVALTRVARHHNSLALIVSSAIAALHPPDKVQKLAATTFQTNAEGESGTFGSQRSLQKAQDDAGGERAVSNTEHENRAEPTDATVQYQASLPFQAQSPWLLFQIASCLVDAVLQGISVSNGFSGAENLFHRSKECHSDWSLPLLTMPVSWELPEYSQFELQASRESLIKLSSATDLCQAIDSCVRHIVELQSGISDECHRLDEDLSKGLGHGGAADCTLKDLVDMAGKQLKSVPVARQKDQARLALIQFVRLVWKIYPDAVHECLRQYEASGRFSRREALSQIW